MNMGWAWRKHEHVVGMVLACFRHASARRPVQHVQQGVHLRTCSCCGQVYCDVHSAVVSAVKTQNAGMQRLLLPSRATERFSTVK